MIRRVLLVARVRTLPVTVNQGSNLPIFYERVKKNLCLKHWQLPVESRRYIFHTTILKKYNKKSAKDIESDDDEEEKGDEFKDERDSKVFKAKINSLRADSVLKLGLGMARNKVENAFYSSKIRVNGQKISKKSEMLNIGDEIDVVRGFSQDNSTHLVVSRVIVLSASNLEEGYSVTLRRYKSLLIDNYPGINTYKSSETVNN